MTPPPENAMLPCPHEWKEIQKHCGEDDEIIYEQQCAKCQKWREEPNRPHVTPVKQQKPASTDVKEAISEVEKALDFTCEYPPSDFVSVKRKYAEILIRAAQPPALPDAPARVLEKSQDGGLAARIQCIEIDSYPPDTLFIPVHKITLNMLIQSSQREVTGEVVEKMAAAIEGVMKGIDWNHRKGDILLEGAKDGGFYQKQILASQKYEVPWKEAAAMAKAVQEYRDIISGKEGSHDA